MLKSGWNTIKWYFQSILLFVLTLYHQVKNVFTTESGLLNLSNQTDKGTTRGEGCMGDRFGQQWPYPRPNTDFSMKLLGY